MSRLIVIDGNSLINRAYFAMQRPMITKEGIYTQGIFGFLNMLNKIEEDYSPDYMAVAFDLKAPTFRHKKYQDYKAGRKPMPPELAMEMPILKDILRAMNIAIFELEGYEADDILGTLTLKAEEKGIEPFVVTGDKDALQLASDKTKVIITKRGVTDFDIYDYDAMIERYSLTPTQFIDLKGIMGDSSDNIPGIPGIGEKGGIELLTQFGSIENMYEHIDEIKKEGMRNKVANNKELCLLSKDIATIFREVPLDFTFDDIKFGKPDYEKLVEIYKKLEFNSFLKKLSIDTKAENIEPITLEKIRVNSLDELRLDPEKETFVKVFGDADHIGKPRLYGIFLAQDKAYYINSDKLDIIEYLNSLNLNIFGHDLKNDLYILMSRGYMNFKISFDTLVAEYCIDVSKSKYDLKSMSLERLMMDVPLEKDFIGDTQMDMFSDSSLKYLDYGEILYNAVINIRKQQEKALKDNGLESLLYDVELPLIEVLSSMEIEGIRCDKDYLDEFGCELKEEISKVEEKIYELAGEKFNIKSPQQLGIILFERLNLPSGKKTKTGYSTAQEILEKLEDKHEIIPEVLKYRNFTKLDSTYIEGMKPLISKDGYVHCHYQQTVTQTGRISCTEPNLQNIPVRTELGRKIRKAFLPSVGHTLVGADYSQIELRVLAHLSGDENLIQAFNNGEDIHKLTASRVLGIPISMVSKEDRSRAKAVNFGVIYGMSSFGLSEEIKTSRKDAQNYIEEYFKKHPSVKEYMDEQIRLTKERSYSETILGRKRTIPEISASNFMVKQLGERLAMNSPIQGSAADIIKMAMNNVYYELKKRNLNSKLILQVHDELIIDADDNELEEIKEMLRRNMEEVMQLKVKLLVELNTASNWYDLK